MEKYFRHLTVKWKLLTIILGVTVLGLIISAVGLSLTEKYYFKRSLVSNLTVLASVIGDNSQAALLFNDRTAANETLSTLRSNKHIRIAYIFDESGHLFATYYRRPLEVEVPDEIPHETQYKFDANDLHLFQPVIVNQKIIGVVYLKSDLNMLTSRLRDFSFASLVLLLGTMVFLTILALALQKWITRPVIHLANTAKAVSQQKNFNLRARRLTDDELGSLVDSFNHMLDEIQRRDVELQKAQSALKKRVKELHKEVFERRRAEQALRESEERTRMIISTALDAVITMNSAGIITGWNPRASEIFGWEKEEALNHNLAEKIVPPIHREAHRNGLQRFLSSGEEKLLNKRFEIFAYHKTGREFPVEIAITSIKMGDETIFSGFVRDITERKEAENQLKHYATELERSNQELEQFAYIASHDLKEPLRGIHNYAMFLIEDYHDKLDDDGKEKLDTLKRLTQRMEQLIDSLLYFSRVGRVDLAIARTDLNDILLKVVDNLHITIQELGFSIRIPQKLPVMKCDRVRISEVFHNLITNALKYNDSEQPWIEIGYFSKDKAMPASTDVPFPNGIGVFYVRDNGIGIRDRHKHLIFRIFKRLHGRNKYGGGTGAGLTIVKRIIERHNGRIWVESEFGNGTTFYFTLWEK